MFPNLSCSLVETLDLSLTFIFLPQCISLLSTNPTAPAFNIYIELKYFLQHHYCPDPNYHHLFPGLFKQPAKWASGICPWHLKSILNMQLEWSGKNKSYIVLLLGIKTSNGLSSLKECIQSSSFDPRTLTTISAPIMSFS